MRPIATTRSATGIPTGRLAIWWVVASEIVIFGGLLVSYIMHRIGHPEWANQAMHTNVVLGATNTFVLLTSSLTAVLGHKAAVEGDGPKAAKMLYCTCFGAVTFLVIKAFEWTTESPPPHGNWPELPTVYRGPYEYSVPGREDDYYPQNVPADLAEGNQ